MDWTGYNINKKVSDKFLGVQLYKLQRGRNKQGAFLTCELEVTKGSVLILPKHLRSSV